MAFADLAKTHAGYIATGPLAEAVELRDWASTIWRAITGLVTRSPVDVAGEVLVGKVEVFLSKTDKPKVTLGRDELRLPADATPGQALPVYRVLLAAERPGGWLLTCAR